MKLVDLYGNCVVDGDGVKSPLVSSQKIIVNKFTLNPLPLRSFRSNIDLLGKLVYLFFGLMTML